LHTAIKELEDEIENPDSILNRTGAGKKSELGLLVKNCNGVLQQLNKKLIKYKSLGSASKRTWDRLRWGAENLQEIREKLLAHTSSLTLFLTTLGTGSLGRIEKKLDQLIEDVRAGRREDTALTFAIGEDDPDESEIQWSLLKGELVEDGFSKSELEGHKHWIKAKLTELIENGGLDEQVLPEYIGSPTAKQGSPQPPVYAEKDGEVSDALKAPPAERHQSPNTADIPKKAYTFQPTVEDADEEENTKEGVVGDMEERQASKYAAAGVQESDEENEENASSGSEDTSGEDPHEDPIKRLKQTVNYGRPISTDYERAREGDMKIREEDDLARRKWEKEVRRAAHGEKKTRDKEKGRGVGEKPRIRAAYVEEASSDGTEDTFLPTVLPTDSISQVGISPPTSKSWDTASEGAKFTSEDWTQAFKSQSFEPPPFANSTRRSHTRTTIDDSDASDDEPFPRVRNSQAPPTVNSHSPRARGYSPGRFRSGVPQPTRYIIDNGRSVPVTDSRVRADTEDKDDRVRIRPSAPISKTERMQSEKEYQYGRPDPRQPIIIRQNCPSPPKPTETRERGSDPPPPLIIRERPPSRPEPIIRQRQSDPLDPIRQNGHARPEPIVIRERRPDPSERVIIEESSNSAREPGSPLPRAQMLRDRPVLSKPSTFQERPRELPDHAWSGNQRPGFNHTAGSQAAESFQFSNPESSFSESLRGQQAQPKGIDPEIPKQMFGFAAASSKPGNGPPPSTTPPVTVVERPVRLTLEELFEGCHKKMKIKRRVFDKVTGRRATQDQILEFDIKPGLKKGSKIKFKGVGDEEEGGQQDLHFIVEEVSKTIPASTLNSSKQIF
jgi:hypothetical protein